MEEMELARCFLQRIFVDFIMLSKQTLLENQYNSVEEMRKLGAKTEKQIEGNLLGE